MSFVVDASVIGAWILPDEGTPATERLLLATSNAAASAPDLLWHEVRSLALIGARRGRVPMGNVQALVEKFNAIAVRNLGRGDDALVLDLARHHSLSTYDATYLALAKSERLPLATLDRRLIVAAQAEGIGLADAGA